MNRLLKDFLLSNIFCVIAISVGIAIDYIWHGSDSIVPSFAKLLTKYGVFTITFTILLGLLRNEK